MSSEWFPFIATSVPFSSHSSDVAVAGSPAVEESGYDFAAVGSLITWVTVKVGTRQTRTVLPRGPSAAKKCP
jgi:hypothetical protein